MRWLFVLALFVLAACGSTEVACNEPYITVGDSCCLDNDANGICDSDEKEPTAQNEGNLDCSSCPPEIITETETIEITKYVCSDGSTVVEQPEDCEEAMYGPSVDFEPDKTNEEDQPFIEEFTVRPACRGGYQGLEIKFTTAGSIRTLEVQTKTDPNAFFETVHTYDSAVTEKYLYGVFCADSCTENADFFLEPNKKHLLRGKFDMSEASWEDIFESNEHVIDHSPNGEYANKLC